MAKIVKDELLTYEKRLWEKGFSAIGGMDEAGRGPLMGPVVAACVCFEKDVYIDGVYDSKALTEKKREELEIQIIDKALSYGIGVVDNQTIDRINILEATKLAMLRALDAMENKPDFLLIDAVKMPLPIPNSPIIKGDQKSFSIAAASILAKVFRDNMIRRLHEEYPEYNWIKNKGYGTLEHREAIKKHGFTPHHRQSFTVR